MLLEISSATMLWEVNKDVAKYLTDLCLDMLQREIDAGTRKMIMSPKTWISLSKVIQCAMKNLPEDKLSYCQRMFQMLKYMLPPRHRDGNTTHEIACDWFESMESAILEGLEAHAAQLQEILLMEEDEKERKKKKKKKNRKRGKKKHHIFAQLSRVAEKARQFQAFAKWTQVVRKEKQQEKTLKAQCMKQWKTFTHHEKGRVTAMREYRVQIVKRGVLRAWRERCEAARKEKQTIREAQSSPKSIIAMVEKPIPVLRKYAEWNMWTSKCLTIMT